MNYKDTKCKACGTNLSPIFVRQPARDNKDYYCQTCIDNKKHLEE